MTRVLFVALLLLVLTSCSAGTVHLVRGETVKVTCVA